MRGKLLAFVAALTLLADPARAASPAEPSEYSLKAVFLYNFCRFMEWPGSAFSSPDEPLTIGVVGGDPFGSLLQEAIAGETYHGRPIRIEHYRNAREIRRCQILFVSGSDTGRMREVLAAVAGDNTLTVGETNAFLEMGGMVALTAERNRVRLRINPAVLRSANIGVSAKLLRVAETKL